MRAGYPVAGILREPLQQEGRALDRNENSFSHGMAAIAPGVTLHYVSAGEGERTIVLLHGFPQTWQEWRHVIPPLVQAGYRIVAPDYRGAGHSSHPLAGYDKRTMARDIRHLVRDVLTLSGPVIFVGHDIGLMVAYAYAEMFRDEVSYLVVIDAPVPGTDVFTRLRTDPRVWHFAFHTVRDIPEMLISGREKAYFQAFFNARLYNVAAMTEREVEMYAAAYTAPGALRAGFELYRAFDQDAADNRAALAANGKIEMPVLAVGGEASTTGPLMVEMMRELATNVTGLRVPRAAHWIAEENPPALLAGLLAFLGSKI
jgi:pimeloyl-ACP methyl ester carboxylesterase